MDELYEQYPAIIALMPQNFTSHEFILALAQRHQRLYVEALHRQTDRNDPFRIIHSQLSKALHDHPDLIQHLGEVESEDIFRQSGRCAQWRRL